METNSENNNKTQGQPEMLNKCTFSPGKSFLCDRKLEDLSNGLEPYPGLVDSQIRKKVVSNLVDGAHPVSGLIM